VLTDKNMVCIFVGRPTNICIFDGFLAIFDGFWPMKISYFLVAHKEEENIRDMILRNNPILIHYEYVHIIFFYRWN
jgi:hypothetical protein